MLLKVEPWRILDNVTMIIFCVGAFLLIAAIIVVLVFIRRRKSKISHSMERSMQGMNSLNIKYIKLY